MSIRDEIGSRWRLEGMLKYLLLINVGVFVALHALHWLNGTQAYLTVLDNLMANSNADWMAHRPWTVLTYMFTHYAVEHILWNLVLFWSIGQLFQDVLGPQRLLGNYLLGGVAGYLFYLLGEFMPAELNLASGMPILGASAAIMSVLVGVATYRPNTLVSVFFLGSIPLKYITMGVLVLDLISIRSGNNTGGHLAHLGGALYGFVAARQLQQGRDLSLGFVRALQRIGSVLAPGKGPRMRVAKKPARRTAPVVLDEQFNAAKRDKQARVDSILDKISRSGYDSLSKEERDFLFRASHEK